MRKSSSKASKTSKEHDATAKARRSSSEPARARNGSTTRSSKSARAKARGNNTVEHDAWRIDPRLSRRFDESLALKNDRQYAKAAQAFARIAEEYPDCGPAHGLCGHILLSGLKRPKDAIAYFRRATQLAPGSELASLGLFHALWESDQIDEALAEIKRYQVLTNYSCQDYLDIVAELHEKWAVQPKSKKTAKPKR